MPVRAEPVVPDRLKPADQIWPIGDQATLEEEVGLLLVRERRLTKISRNKEKPARFEHDLTARGLAGVLP
jgi:hypothetical protein